MGGGLERRMFVDKKQVNATREADLDLLEKILHDEKTTPAVKIQAIQTREKILSTLEEQLGQTEERAIDKVLAAIGE